MLLLKLFMFESEHLFTQLCFCRCLILQCCNNPILMCFILCVAVVVSSIHYLHSFRAQTFNQVSCKIPKFLCRLLLLLQDLIYLMADLNFNDFVRQQAMQIKLQSSGVHKLKLLGCQEYFTALTARLRTGNIINISRKGSHSFPNVVVMSLPSDTSLQCTILISKNLT